MTNDLTESTLPLEQLRQIRIEKLKKLKSLGIDPYPSKSNRTHNTTEITDKFSELEGKAATVAGRLMSWREHGALIFSDLQDQTGKIQLYIKSDTIESFNKENSNLGFDNLKILDIGDFVEAHGEITKTKSGQISILVKTLRLLTKSLRPLPSSHFGLKDEEERYRQRYVELSLYPEVREMFIKKSKFWNSIRQFMLKKEFLEVETPVLENTAGGADAKPFITHHNALDIDLFLRISMGELWQKRLMVGGFEKTFEIGRQFRNEGMSREHLQDYTQMEFYWAYANYLDSMKLVEELYKFAAQETFGTLQFKIGEFDVDFSGEWKKINFRQTILDNLGIDISKASKEEMISKAKELKLDADISADKGRLMDILWKVVRKSIAGPVFLIGHPVEVSPLAKRDPSHPEFVERYQVIIAGSEQGNGYSELNDPIDQANRFEEQQKLREAGDDEAQMHDYDFVRALEYGMPPVSGFGVSERLFSFLADKPIKECVLFPLLRPEVSTVVAESISNIEVYSSSDYSIDPQVEKDFPGIFFAYVLIKNVDIDKSNKIIDTMKKDVLSEAGGLTLNDLEESKPIAAYRDIFTKTGVDLRSKKPSPEALLRRVISGKGIYNINSAVDAYNLAVIETHIGLGGFDAKYIKDAVVLRYAKSGEKAHLLGDDAPTEIKDGQMIYADAEKPITVNLNYRDIDKTKITEKTKDILLFADGAPGLSEEAVVNALRKGADYINATSKGEIGKIHIIKHSVKPASKRLGVKSENLVDQKIMNKEKALKMLHDNMQNQNLRRHCYAVGCVMASIYDYLKEKNMLEADAPDRDTWEVAGILHDSDYEITKDDHTRHTILLLEWLEKEGITKNDALYKIMESHNNKVTGLREVQTQMEWALETCDELAGFIVACALVMPERKLDAVQFENVKKKWPQKAFAKGVIREQVEQCADKLSISLDDFIRIALDSMKKNAAELGL